MDSISRVKKVLWSGLLPVVLLLNSQTALAFSREYSLANTGGYFDVIARISIPRSASGKLSGSAASGDVFVSDGDYFDVSYTKDFPFSGVNGVKERLDFILAGGPINYSYEVPYTLSFDFPTEVFPGQRIYLNPTISWGLPWLQADQSFDFATVHSQWLNVPYDSIAALDVQFKQYHDRLELSGSLPLGPFLPAVSVSATLDANSPSPLNDFSDGAADIQGVIAKLGGHGQLVTSGGNRLSVGETSLALNTDGNSFTDAWYSAGDQIEFGTLIPYVTYVATPLNWAGFVLNHVMDVDPFRQDAIWFNVTSFPYIDIPDDVTPGTNYTFNVSVPLEYKGTAYSNFAYVFSTKIDFDGPGFGKQTLLDVSLGSLNLGFGTAPTEFAGISNFTVSGTVPVVDGCAAVIAQLAAIGRYLTPSEKFAVCSAKSQPPYRVAANFSHPPMFSPPAGTTPATPADTTSHIIPNYSYNTVAAGAAHTVALKSDGTLWAWGLNDHGQLGDGTDASKFSPLQIGTDADWLSLSGGAFYTVALKSDGTLWGWGGNVYGQLGPATAGTYQFSRDQIGTDGDWVAVSAGNYHTVALKSDGTLWSWGRNNYGQLGGGTSSESRPLPTKVGSETDWVSAAASGAYFTVALKANGTLWSWGDNTYGQLGDGTTDARYVPTQVGTGTDWVSAAAGDYHTIALKSDGSLWAWGLNDHGQLGDGTNTNRLAPIQIGTDLDWASVTAGGAFFTVALKSDGSLWSWGGNSYGQLGDGTTNWRNYPLRIGTDTTWVSIAAGEYHAAAQKTDGSLWAWGRNDNGQLGTGTTVGRRSAVQVLGNLPPAANAGPDQMSEATSQAGAAVTLDGTGSSDPEAGSLACDWTGDFGTVNGATPTIALSFGSHLVTLTVTDDQGLTATDTVRIVVGDTTSPVLALPADIVAQATSPAGAAVAYATSAFDGVDGEITPFCTPASGATFAVGATTVVCTATDSAGNAAAPGMFHVIVTTDLGTGAGGHIPPAAGGTVTTPDGSVSISVPPGAVGSETYLSIAETGAGYVLTSNLGMGLTVYGVAIQSHGTAFNAPVTITFAWPDADNDGTIDGTNIKEQNVLIVKDGAAITGRCGDAAGPLEVAGAECSTAENTFKVQVLSLSIFALVYVDTQGPALSGTAAAPAVAPVNLPVALSAVADDTTTGGSNIARAGYSIDGGANVAMAAQDGTFDEVREDVVAQLPAFPEAGLYTICVRAWDRLENAAGPAECIFLPVFDPTEGFVTGGGWITSPLGAYVPDPTLTGKATFGFVSKYQKGKTVPIGQTEFQFKLANLNFHSESYEWLVVAGARAQYKGTGTVNGSGNFRFMLTAIDGEISGGGVSDKFRIKIWDKATGSIVYDNHLGATDADNPVTGLGGGSITIHQR